MLTTAGYTSYDTKMKVLPTLSRSPVAGHRARSVIGRDEKTIIPLQRDSAIGIGDPGTVIAYATSSVEISRGTTKQLLLNGTGMSAASRTSVSISGGGVALTSLIYQGNMIFVTATVNATAALGPRNIILTNANLDTSISTGGLIVR